MSTCALLFFGKCPTPGRVKTRLARSLGDESAAALAEAFLRDGARRYGAVPSCAPVLAADRPHEPFWKEAFPLPWRIEGQGDGDLGKRLARAFSRELAGFRKVVAIGSDHPALPTEALARFLAEENAIWPTRDGGYAAILLSRADAVPRLFKGIDWSTDRVLVQTMERASADGIAMTRFPETYDVDDESDLDLLARDLSSRDVRAPDFPSHTWKVLRSLSRMSLR